MICNMRCCAGVSQPLVQVISLEFSGLVANVTLIIIIKVSQNFSFLLDVHRKYRCDVRSCVG